MLNIMNDECNTIITLGGICYQTQRNETKRNDTKCNEKQLKTNKFTNIRSRLTDDVH